ncbi:MAG: alginate O-acetyltransferase AlgX-related protein [Rhodobacterales bacterium]
MNDAPRGNVQAARSAAAAGDARAALRLWQQVCETSPPDLAPELAEALCGTAAAHLALEDYAAALDAALTCSARFPNHKPARDMRARIMGRASQRVQVQLAKLPGSPMLRLAQPERSVTRRELGQSELRGWAALPRGTQAELVLEGADGSQTLYPLDLPAKALLRLPSPRAPLRLIRDVRGFVITVDLGAVARIGLKQADGVRWTHAVNRQEIATTLEGTDGWLFLTNDGNRSDEVFTGALQLPLWRRALWHVFARRLAQETRRLAAKGTKLAFVIAPSKESVLPQHYPLPRGARILTDDVLAILHRWRVPVEFPVPDLAAQPGSYCRTDTHWSHLGAMIALEGCLDRFGHEGDWRAHLSFAPLAWMGDLGAKQTPPVKDDLLVARWSAPQRLRHLYRSGLLTTGEITVVENEAAPVQEVLVIFGGSSASVLAHLASRIFRRVVRLNCPSTQPVMEVIAAEGAAYVICQTNERYLMRAPRVVQRLSDSAIPAAVDALDPGMRQRLAETSAAAGPDNIYARFLADCLTSVETQRKG